MTLEEAVMMMRDEGLSLLDIRRGWVLHEDDGVFTLHLGYRVVRQPRKGRRIPGRLYEVPDGILLTVEKEDGEQFDLSIPAGASGVARAILHSEDLTIVLPGFGKVAPAPGGLSYGIITVAGDCGNPIRVWF